MINTSGVTFRDHLVHACIHAGYSAYFRLGTRAGTVRGYRPVPSERAHSIYSLEEKEAGASAQPRA